MSPDIHKDRLPGLESLPLICQTEVNKILDRTQQLLIRKRAPLTPEEFQGLVPQVLEKGREVFCLLEPFRNPADPTESPSIRASATAGGLIYEDPEREATYEEASRKLNQLSFESFSGFEEDMSDLQIDASMAIGEYASYAITCAVIKDKQGFINNPFLPFISLLELGASSIVFVWAPNDKGEPEEQLYVDFPILTSDGKQVTGKIAVGPSGSTRAEVCEEDFFLGDFSDYSTN